MRTSSDPDTRLENAVQVFRDYVGLKLHFNDQFVWHRGFRSRLGRDQLIKRKDAYMFIKTAEEMPDREKRIQVFISAFKKDPKAWIGDIYEEDHQSYHKKRMAVVNSLRYSFSTDIDKIVMFMEERKIDVRGLLASKDKPPYIIRHESDIPGGVKDETYALIEKAFKFCKLGQGDPLWERRSFMYSKYHYWLNIDPEFFDQQLSKLVAVEP